MDAITVVCGLAMLIGLVGIVIPVLPGLIVVVLAAVLWGIEHGGPVGYGLIAMAVISWIAGLVLQYTIPGKRMRAAGVPTSTLLIGLAVGIVGMFVIPVVGLFIGFPLGIYAVEHARLKSHDAAWIATKHALRAVGTNILIELTAATAIIASFVVAVFVS